MKVRSTGKLIIADIKLNQNSAEIKLEELKGESHKSEYHKAQIKEVLDDASNDEKERITAIYGEDDSFVWEEFLADFDVNDNGVLDEEDFEAGRERGDEDLPPSWDDALQELGDTNGDGVIDQGEYERQQEHEDEEDSGLRPAMLDGKDRPDDGVVHAEVPGQDFGKRDEL